MLAVADFFTGIGAWLRNLPTGAKVVAGVVLLAALGVGSVFMYRTYDYVQHDNQFCLECHLMRDPFERFAQSAHRGLGCKACHRPNIVERSQMGLAQIVEQPDSIRVHAHVPNSVCAECHIDGDPEEWLRVASTAGHRIHFESNDPALQGLNCVECHSSGVHQFTPTDQTCGQGGCHESTEIRLGEMAELTIHCATCHDFATPVDEDAPPEQVAMSLRPQAEECLSCHQMRSMLTDFPEDEPHNAACGACHNPHEQTVPAEAVQSCATGGCHAQPDTITPFHRGLDPGALENCLSCHVAHEFRIHGGGEDCLSCHAEIFQDRPGSGGRVSGHPDVRFPGPSAAHPEISSANPEVSAAHPAVSSGHPERARPAAEDAHPAVRLASAGPGADRLALLALARHEASSPARAPQQGQDSLAFWHAQHRGVECTACHSTQRAHGALTVTSLRDCRSCHHTEPVAGDCLQCHARSEVQGVTARLSRRMDLRIGGLDRPTRQLPFDHAEHLGSSCRTCHTQGVELSAAAIDCSSCHDEHHQPDAECMSCHRTPADGAHGMNVHLGCAGSGCHETAAASIRDVPRTRDFCLVCHQDLTDHRPGRNCVNCHALPRPGSQARAAGESPRRAEEL